MAHFIYAMQSASTPPASGGTTLGWFLYYKWDVGGEAFVPVPEQSLACTGGAPTPGDTLWFLMDDRVMGYTTVSHTMDDPLNGMTEVYYDTRQIRDLGEQTTYYMQNNTGKCVSSGDVARYDQLLSLLAPKYSPRGDKAAGALATLAPKD